MKTRPPSLPAWPVARCWWHRGFAARPRPPTIPTSAACCIDRTSTNPPWRHPRRYPRNRRRDSLAHGRQNPSRRGTDGEGPGRTPGPGGDLYRRPRRRSALPQGPHIGQCATRPTYRRATRRSWIGPSFAVGSASNHCRPARCPGPSGRVRWRGATCLLSTVPCSRMGSSCRPATTAPARCASTWCCMDPASRWAQANCGSHRGSTRPKPSPKPPPEQDFIELHPLGRVENCYRWAGETDVFEAIEAVCRNYRIDRRRIVLRGMSMGASGTWHLGLKHPDEFVALGPYFGYVDTRPGSRGRRSRDSSGSVRCRRRRNSGCTCSTRWIMPPMRPWSPPSGPSATATSSSRRM